MDEIEEGEDWIKTQPFLVLEYAEHRTLKDPPSCRSLSTCSRNLALDTALGVNALHSCGIAHGDIKLENVLMFTNCQR
jgi:serine/threonine protein kinase